MARLFLFLIIPAVLTAQVRWWGEADFGVLKGGADSQIGKNGLPNEYVQMTVRELQLYCEAAISDAVSVTVRLGNRPASTAELNTIGIQLAYATFSNLAGDALSVSVGKMLTPFGAFAKRQLPSQNPFLGMPLFFSYVNRISPETGYLDANGIAWAASAYGGQLSTMYRGGYYTGVSASGVFFHSVLEYEVAAMNAPLSSFSADVNADNGLAVHGRIAVNPALWAALGVSYAAGSFMKPSPANAYFRDYDNSLDRYTQTTMGSDLRLSYLFYELNVEYIRNAYKAPYIAHRSATSYVSGLSHGESLALDSDELLADLKLEAPFYPGLYLALRWNAVWHSSIEDPDAASSTYYLDVPWDADCTRYAVAIGWKPHPSVVLKAGYETTEFVRTPHQQLDLYGLSVVLTF